VGRADRGRKENRRGKESKLPWGIGDVLAEPPGRRRCEHLRGARHAVLRQGRAEPGDPYRACGAGMSLLERRCVWRRGMKDRRIVASTTKKGTAPAWLSPFPGDPSDASAIRGPARPRGTGAIGHLLPVGPHIKDAPLLRYLLDGLGHI